MKPPFDLRMYTSGDLVTLEAVHEGDVIARHEYVNTLDKDFIVDAAVRFDGRDYSYGVRIFYPRTRP